MNVETQITDAQLADAHAVLEGVDPVTLDAVKRAVEAGEDEVFLQTEEDTGANDVVVH